MLYKCLSPESEWNKGERLVKLWPLFPGIISYRRSERIAPLVSVTAFVMICYLSVIWFACLCSTVCTECQVYVFLYLSFCYVLYLVRSLLKNPCLSVQQASFSSTETFIQLIFSPSRLNISSQCHLKRTELVKTSGGSDTCLSKNTVTGSVFDASDVVPDNIALPQDGNVVEMILMWWSHEKHMEKKKGPEHGCCSQMLLIIMCQKE